MNNRTSQKTDVFVNTMIHGLLLQGMKLTIAPTPNGITIEPTTEDGEKMSFSWEFSTINGVDRDVNTMVVTELAFITNAFEQQRANAAQAEIMAGVMVVGEGEWEGAAAEQGLADLAGEKVVPAPTKAKRKPAARKKKAAPKKKGGRDYAAIAAKAAATRKRNAAKKAKPAKNVLNMKKAKKAVRKPANTGSVPRKVVKTADNVLS